MQIKPTVIYYLIYVIMAIINKTKDNKQLVRVWIKGKSYALLMGIYCGTV